jgi:hypothetical protein
MGHMFTAAMPRYYTRASPEVGFKQPQNHDPLIPSKDHEIMRPLLVTGGTDDLGAVDPLCARVWRKELPPGENVRAEDGRRVAEGRGAGLLRGGWDRDRCGIEDHPLEQDPELVSGAMHGWKSNPLLKVEIGETNAFRMMRNRHQGVEQGFELARERSCRLGIKVNACKCF